MGEGRRRRWLVRAQVGLGLLLGFAALVLLVRSASLDQLLAALRELRPVWVVLTVAVGLLTPVAKARRWRWLFHPLRPDLGFGQLASLIVIGQAVNFLAPGRWGELVRSYLAGEEAGVSKWFVLGTLAAEKLLDVVVLAVLVAVLLPAVVLPAGLTARAGIVLVTALVLGALATILLAGRTQWLGLAGRLLRVLPSGAAERWQARVRAGLDGLGALGDRRVASAIWGWTLVSWGLAGLTNLALLLAFDLPPSPVVALVLLTTLQAGVAPPSTPGKIGVFPLLCVLALAVFGISEPVGLAYGLVLHVLVVGMTSIWAALALWRRSWNLRHLAAASAGPG